MTETKGIDWSLAFKGYQFITELCSKENLVSRTSEFIEMVCSAHNADHALVIQSSDSYTVYGKDGTSETTQDALIEFLPLLYDSLPLTRFEEDELSKAKASFECFSSLSLCDGYYYSFNVESFESMWILIFNEESSGVFTEEVVAQGEEAAQIVEQFFTTSQLGETGGNLLTALEGQKKQQSIWLESLDWLNSHGKMKLSPEQLAEFYSSSLYQLNLLAGANFSLSYLVNAQKQLLKNVSLNNVDEATLEALTAVVQSDFPWESSNSNDELYELNIDLSAQGSNVKILAIFPVFIQKKVKRILCLGLLAPLNDSQRQVAKLFTEGLNHIIERNYFQGALSKSVKLLIEEKEEQAKLIGQLEEAKDQLFQQEKLASIGQLAAGVAHEINNPVGYVSSNISTMNRYVDGLFNLLETYKRHESALSPEAKAEIDELKDDMDFDDYREEISEIISESKEGVSRVKQIVGDLKDFSHVSESQFLPADLSAGITSTLNIVNNEIKFKADVVKEFDEVPQVECTLSRINQVVMNLVVNASHAIEEKGIITIRLFSLDEDHVCIEVEDNGKGIEEKNLAKLFDPFFTTKPVGEGTGLGLSLSYSIIETHNGELTVRSTVGKGTTFRITLPIKHVKGTG